MERYWVYIDSKVQGPVEVPALRKLSGFTLLTQVCLENEQTWRVADDIVEIKAYFLAPPRVSSMPHSQGNLALKVEPEVVAGRSVGDSDAGSDHRNTSGYAAPEIDSAQCRNASFCGDAKGHSAGDGCTGSFGSVAPRMCCLRF